MLFDSGLFFDSVSTLKWSVCEECGIVTINGNDYNATLFAFLSDDALECETSDGVLYDQVKVLEELG